MALLLWRSIQRHRSIQSPSLLPTPKPDLARSILRRLALVQRSNCAASCSRMTGVNMVHVPYRGNAPALTDLIAGQVQVMFADTPSSIEHVRSGKLRALAVTTAERSEILPGVPTVGEFLPGFQASNWFGVAAPRNSPPEIIDKLNKEINVALAEPDIKARLADLGAAPLAGSPADFGRFIAAEAEKWSKVIRAANIKVD